LTAIRNGGGGDLQAAAAALVRRFARFSLVGALGLAVDAGLFALLVHHGAGEYGARALSLAVATLVTWNLNRRFTFAASGRGRSGELARYALVALSAQGLNYLVFVLLRGAVPALPALGALLCGAGAAALFSFTGQRFFTFAPAAAPRPSSSHLEAGCPLPSKP
jgi:putative flippase GtrA